MAVELIGGLVMRRFSLFGRAAIVACTSVILASTPVVAGESSKNSMQTWKGSLKDRSVASADWSGLYLGVSFGGGWGDSLFDLRVAGFPNNSNPDIDGLAGGAHVGFNHQWRSIVVGVEGRGLVAGIQGDAPDRTNPIVFMRTEIDWLIAGLGKVGVTRGNWLAYGTGGYALAAHKATASVPIVGAVVGQREERHGYAWGGGLEAKRGNLIFGVDYLHVDLEDHIRPGFNNVGNNPNLARHRADADLDIVTARVSYKFNGGNEIPYK